jgi:hypothetical protein
MAATSGEQPHTIESACAVVNGDALAATARELGRDADAELITLRQAAAELPRRRAGKKTHVSCIYRWTSDGLRGIKLRYAQCGATRCTTRRWLAEFFDALAAVSRGDAPASFPDSAARRRELERVDAELDRRLGM